MPTTESIVDQISANTFRVVKSGRTLGFIDNINGLCVVSSGPDQMTAFEILQTRSFDRAVKELDDRS